jgi:G3E family GTPase
VETTGLAHPGPVAQTFFLPDLAKILRLDAIVTVADARHIEHELAQTPEAGSQIAFADVILLNKTDLVSRVDLARVEARIRHMNALARIHRTQRAQIDAATILDIKARDLNAPSSCLWQARMRKSNKRSTTTTMRRKTGTKATAEPEHGHYHDEQVRSFSIVEDRPLDLKRTEAWIGELIGSMGANIYRCKGILHIRGQPKRVVCQGVQMMFDATPERFWNPGENRQSRMVFIGKELDEVKIRAGFESCLAM